MNAVPPVCDDCGGPYIAPKCPLPHDEEKIKKSFEACVKAQAGRLGGCGHDRSGCGSHGGGFGNKQGQWSSSNSSASTNAATANQGIECINNVWMMKCKDCGWNTTHTSKYCDEAKRQGDSFSVPATHPYWGLSKKAHPSATVAGLATAAGSATTNTEKNDGSSSTISLYEYID